MHFPFITNFETAFLFSHNLSNDLSSFPLTLLPTHPLVLVFCCFIFFSLLLSISSHCCLCVVFLTSCCFPFSFLSFWLLLFLFLLFLLFLLFVCCVPFFFCFLVFLSVILLLGLVVRCQCDTKYLKGPVIFTASSLFCCKLCLLLCILVLRWFLE